MTSEVEHSMKFVWKKVLEYRSTVAMVWSECLWGNFLSLIYRPVEGNFWTKVVVRTHLIFRLIRRVFSPFENFSKNHPVWRQMTNCYLYRILNPLKYLADYSLYIILSVVESYDTGNTVLIVVFPCMLIITQLLFQQNALVFFIIKSTKYYNLYFLSLYS
jgi:hypothetical protein